jgi:hypothetical protein
LPRPSVSAAIAALWHGLARFADLRCVRAALVNDRSYRIDGRFTGTVAGWPVDEPISCLLTASSPIDKASSHSAPTDELLALVLAEVPLTRRQALMDSIEAHWQAHGELPAQQAEAVQGAKKWKKRLNASQTKTVEGPVTVQLDPDEDALAAAEAKWQDGVSLPRRAA